MKLMISTISSLPSIRSRHTSSSWNGDGFGLLHVFDGCSKIKHDDNGDHLEIVTPKGTRRVYYKGGGKADSHKSITGLSLGSVYFCEIDLLHMNMVQECFRRTFAAKNRWHIADLNPPAPQHPVIKEVFDVQDTYWQHWTIDDNPIITPERKETDPADSYQKPVFVRA